MSGPETLWQELICRLEGVQAAKVVFAENGMPCEIHVLAGPEKSAKSLVRDIQSALTAQFGVQVDHRIISVAPVSYTHLDVYKRQISHRPVVVF